MSTTTANGSGGLESIIEGAKVMAIAGTTAAGMYLGIQFLPELFGAVSPYAKTASQIVGAALGGIGGYAIGKPVFEGIDYVVKTFPTTLPQFLGGTVLAVPTYFALASTGVGLIPALMLAGATYIAGTGVGTFIHSKAPQTAEFIKGLYGDSEVKKICHSIRDSIISLEEGVKTRYANFTKNVKELFTFHLGPKPAH
jgi:hypothetical protein